MTRKQKADTRLSEIRQELNKYAGKDSLTSEESAKVAELEGKLRAAEVEQRAAIREEAETAAETPADPQLGALERRCELRNYLGAVVAGRQFTGAELEFQQARELSGHHVPIEAFAPPVTETETRADATTNAPASVGQSQRAVLSRVFARSAATWLGYSMHMVGPGESLFPVVSSGNTPARLAKGSGHGDIAAGTLTAFKLTPTASQVMYSYRLEDQALFGSALDMALRQDMSGAMAEHLDAQLIAGNGTAPNIPGFFNELTAATATTTVATFNSALASFGTLVDGRYADRQSDLRALMGAATYGLLASVFANNGKGDLSAAAALERTLGGLRVSPHVPAASSDDQSAVVALGRHPGSAVAAIWPSVELIIDRVTGKKERIVQLSMVQLYDAKIIREAAFALASFHLA